MILNIKKYSGIEGIHRISEKSLSLHNSLSEKLGNQKNFYEFRIFTATIINSDVNDDVRFITFEKFR